MSRATEKILSSVVLCPRPEVDVRLRGSVERTVFLSIGGTAEITLHEKHVRALRADIATALYDMEQVDAADQSAGTAYDAGAQARRAAAVAREQADLAERRGHLDLAAKLRRRASSAIAAADAAQAAAEEAVRAIGEAEEATERITRIIADAADPSTATERPSRSTG